MYIFVQSKTVLWVSAFPSSTYFLIFRGRVNSFLSIHMSVNQYVYHDSWLADTFHIFLIKGHITKKSIELKIIQKDGKTFCFHLNGLYEVEDCDVASTTTPTTTTTQTTTPTCMAGWSFYDQEVIVRRSMVARWGRGGGGFNIASYSWIDCWISS